MAGSESSRRPCGQPPRRKRLHGGVVVLLVVIISVSASACNDWTGDYGEGSFESNGERIYFTATSASGEPITRSGGAFMMHQRGACVDCHGPGGRGGQVRMMMWSFEAPDITWDNLTQVEDHEEEPGREQHEDHPPYADDTLKRAITEGVDPAGEPLDEVMPRWRMSEQDLSDLLGFIKTLE